MTHSTISNDDTTATTDETSTITTAATTTTETRSFLGITNREFSYRRRCCRKGVNGMRQNRKNA